MIHTRRTGIAIALLIAAAMAAQLAAYWPGVMIWDSIRQYRQALSGRYDDWHPPAMNWLWHQLLAIHAGPAPMLVLQALIGWGGIALLAGWAVRAGRPRLAAALVACALMPIPFALGGAVIKDSLMAAFTLLAAGLIACTHGRAGWRLRAMGLAALVAASTLRFNALPATLPLAVALLPAHWRETRANLVAATLLLAVPLALAMPAANRLLDAQRSGVGLSLVIFDLGGITKESGADAFPPLDLADPVAIDRRCYDPEKWDSYAWWVDAPCPIGFDRVGAALRRQGANPYAFLARAILRHPWAYARHRLHHFAINSRLLARGPVERPVFAESDPNPWGYRVAPGPLLAAIDRAALWSAATPIGWPIWWMALAAGVLILWRRLETGWLAGPLALSSLLYGLFYLAVSVASEMRYHLWTVEAAALATVIAAADLVNGAPAPRRRLALALAPVVLVTLIAGAWRLA